jgi:hypothetical protein
MTKTLNFFLGFFQKRLLPFFKKMPDTRQQDIFQRLNEFLKDNPDAVLYVSEDIYAVVQKQYDPVPSFIIKSTVLHPGTVIAARHPVYTYQKLVESPVE